MAYATIALKEFSYVDSNGNTITYEDIYLDETGNIAVVYDDDAVNQTVKSALRLWLGEYYLDTTIGMNYKIILGEKPNQALIFNEIRNNLLRLKNVVSVTNISITTNNKNRVNSVAVSVKSKLSNKNLNIKVSV